MSMLGLKPAAVLTAALTVAALAGCGSSNDAASDTASDSASAPSTATGSSAAAPGTTCSYPADPAGSAGKKVSTPPATPSVSGKVPATISTSVGDLKLTLDADTAPCAVNSFASLAKQDFYAGTHCHRLGDTPGFQMLQCGDPTGTGSGGPGYSFADELTGTETYGAGTLAMANSGPNTNGSQFFMVFGDTQLDPNYTVFGQLDPSATAALTKAAAKGIANPGPDGTGEPKEPVTFTKITVG